MALIANDVRHLKPEIHMFKELKNKILIYLSNLLLRVVAVTHGFLGLEKYTKFVT